MNCIQAREAMLIAEPAELRAESKSELAAHLAECDACRSLACALTGDLDLLSSRIRVRSRRRTFVLAALPIAAVLVAAVTLVSNRRGPERPAVATGPRSDRPANVVSVDVGVGQQATVIKTADPKTTLVWISSGSN